MLREELHALSNNYIYTGDAPFIRQVTQISFFSTDDWQAPPKKHYPFWCVNVSDTDAIYFIYLLPNKCSSRYLVPFLCFAYDSRLLLHHILAHFVYLKLWFIDRY